LDVVYQNSGTAGSGLLGVAPMGLQGTQFFPLTANSGSLNVNISGGSIATTPPAYQSGTLVVLSGGTAGLSGLVVTDSGSVVNLGSGIISTSGIANVVIAGSGGTAPAVGTAGADGVPTAAPGMLTKGELYGFNGSNFDRVRTTQGAAGTGIGILAAGLFWQYALVSGAVLSNVQSGASVLHTVTINAWVSGGQIKVMDSLSGNTGSPIAQIAYTEVGSLATNAFIPLTLDYDCIANSGIVVITSGTGMNVTIAFRSPI
ncbi:MAG TPA: hypothetical protein VJR06_01165, partial [Nitrososphaerales archaeon]|nr:hypothetical protein [Nitrososphaerales archaeon]